MEEIIPVRKSILFALLMTTFLLVACGGNDERKKNTPVDTINNDTSGDVEKVDNDMNDDENNTNEFVLVDASLDISEGITEAYDFFDNLYFSDTEIIDEEIGLQGAEVTVYLDNQDRPNTATLKAYTIEPQNSLRLSVNINPDDFDNKLTKTDADGNKMAIEVADDAYEYAGKLMWKKDDFVYELDGGRSRISTVKENEIHPEEDRLLFYKNLIPTNNELKTYDEFYQNIKMPTQLPEGFTLYRVSLFYEQPLGLSKKPPARILYETKGQNNESIMFLVYGEYKNAPKLSGDNIRVENLSQTTVQIDEEKLLFTLNDETYEIHYSEIPEETILEIAKSIIEQAE